MRVELKEREREFVNDQIMRDQELIKLMEVKEKEMEHNLLHKAEAFRYLYKEHQKEITPSNASYKYELVNLQPSKSQSHRKRK